MKMTPSGLKARTLLLTILLGIIGIVLLCRTPGHRPAPQSSTTELLHSILDTSDTIRALNPFNQHLDSMPPGGRKLKINLPPGGTLGRVFNDSNFLHLASAQALGIDPITSPATAWQAGGQPLERVVSGPDFYVDHLRHSLPFLTPEAHNLLHMIGRSFRDSLASRGGGDYRIKVTSILRTTHSVSSLRRRNRNATDSSAHLYATTFDISYAKFICDDARCPRTQEDLKNLLGEIIYSLRNQGLCHVKYERKQACFHITARPDAAIPPTPAGNPRKED